MTPEEFVDPRDRLQQIRDRIDLMLLERMEYMSQRQLAKVFALIAGDQS